MPADCIVLTRCNCQSNVAACDSGLHLVCLQATRPTIYDLWAHTAVADRISWIM